METSTDNSPIISKILNLLNHRIKNILRDLSDKSFRSWKRRTDIVQSLLFEEVEICRQCGRAK